MCQLLSRHPHLSIYTGFIPVYYQRTKQSKRNTESLRDMYELRIAANTPVAV
jgi:hypothetical protein